MAKAGAAQASELRELTAEELVLRLKEYKEELFNLRFQMATGQLANHRQIRHVRHNLAQILTEIHMKEFNAPSGPAPVEPEIRPRRGRAPAASEGTA